MTGIVVGMVVVMAITATGVIGVFLAIPGVAPVVATAAALYVVYLAFRIATAPPLAENAGQVASRRSSVAPSCPSSIRRVTLRWRPFSRASFWSESASRSTLRKAIVLVAIMIVINAA
jgi:threonine/homoserine/homoserine lactone efflux protein